MSKRVANIIQNESTDLGPATGRTMSPRAIDQSYEDSLRATQQYGVTFFLCARDYEVQSLNGAPAERHTMWYIRREGKAGATIPTRINLALDPPSIDLLNAFGTTAEKCREDLDARTEMQAADSDPRIEDDDEPAPETFFCDVCDTAVPSGAAGDDVVCRGCGRVLSLAPSTPAAPADPAPAIDRSTTIQTQGASIQSRADAIKARVARITPLLEGLRDGYVKTDAYRDILAKLDGIAGDAMQIAGEAGLVISADEYQQQRRQAAESKFEALESI